MPFQNLVNYIPQYLGPSATHMVLLLILIVANSITWFALSIPLVWNVWALCVNVTTIESWEISRHETLIRRARASGGCLDAPGGRKVRITRQEFPYDVGILRNICQGMGGSPFSWLWPFAASFPHESGYQFETNGFEGKMTQFVHRLRTHISRPKAIVASSRPRSHSKTDENARATRATERK